MRVFATASRRHAAALLLFVTLAPLRADPAGVTMSVQPKLCIVDRYNPSCEFEYVVNWQSNGTGDYCLHEGADSEPLDCWQDASSGRYDAVKVVERDVELVLLEGPDGTPVAAAAIRVLDAGGSDRRRERRRRHVWSIL